MTGRGHDSGPAACPSLEALERYANDPTDAPELADHIETCHRCTDMLAGIGCDNDLLGEFVAANAERLVAEQPLTVDDPPPGYEISDEIHRGSQGVVYRAHHTATKRTVALKVTLQGAFASPRQRLRFEREVELIASLRHPGIVTLYDSGITPAGRPFLAMELVDGVPLDEHMQRHPCSVADTLALFAQVCEAVTIAHRRGIIHRDLKPANIVVDGTGRPRVLDFGVAKTIDAERAGASPLETVAGEFIGTFAYAAPEQVAGDPTLVDTRIDEYALGVVLYELLTGRRPYELAGSMQQVIETIRHATPLPPSQHRPEVDADVDTIVLRALAKDPDRRYQSVQALLDDVRHTLSGAPINARRDDRWYVLRRTLAGHKREVAALCGVFLIVLASAVAGWSLYSQRVVAMQRQGLALAGLLETIASADLEDPDAPMPASSFLDLLDMSSTMVGQLSEFPQDEAAVRTRLGLAYLSFSHFDDAGLHLGLALAIQRDLHDRPHADLATALHNRARAYWKAGHYETADSMYRDALAMRRTVLGDEHEDVARTLHHLATVLRDLGRLAESEAMNHEALAMRRKLLAPDAPDIGNSLNGLGNCLVEQARFAEAIPYFREALALVPRNSESGDWRASRVMHNLARCYIELDELDTARGLLDESLAIKRSYRADDDLDVVRGVHEQARIDLREGRLEAAEASCRSALDAREARYERAHAEQADSLMLLGRILLARGEDEDATAVLREAAAVRRATAGAGWRLAIAESLIGESLHRQGLYDEAEPRLVNAMVAIRAELGADALPTQEARARVVALYVDWGRLEEAAAYRE